MARNRRNVAIRRIPSPNGPVKLGHPASLQPRCGGKKTLRASNSVSPKTPYLIIIYKRK